MKYTFFILTLIVLVFQACDTEKTPATNMTANKVKSFTADPIASALADSILASVGGAEAWENTEYLQWNFFENRKHVWHKKTGDIIIQGLRQKYNIKMNLNTMQGTANFNGVQYENPDTLRKYLAIGRDMWRNDSYWLFLPFKLKDPGVNLKYLGEENFKNVQNVKKLELTFDKVGKTPQNRYVLYVHPQYNKIMHWDYYEHTSDTEPKLSTGWNIYKPCGDIQLSASRGEGYYISDISCDDSLARFFKK